MKEHRQKIAKACFIGWQCSNSDQIWLYKAETLFEAEQIDEIADMVASNPMLGDLMRGTGGFRKFRYAGVQSKGKSGGMRVIHLFVASDGEVHLIDIFEKSDKNNLTQAERNDLAKIASILKGDTP